MGTLNLGVPQDSGYSLRVLFLQEDPNFPSQSPLVLSRSPKIRSSCAVLCFTFAWLQACVSLLAVLHTLWERLRISPHTEKLVPTYAMKRRVFTYKEHRKAFAETPDVVLGGATCESKALFAFQVNPPCQPSSVTLMALTHTPFSTPPSVC